MSAKRNARTALLLIDAQRNMLEGKYAIVGPDDVLRVLGRLLADARASGAPVIHVQHCGPPGAVDEPGTEGWQIHPALAPFEGEPVVQKKSPSAFEDTELATVLESLEVGRLVVAGMQSEMCVTATCRAASARGYEVVLARDGHGTYDDGAKPAAEVVREVNAALASVARLTPGAAVSFEPARA